MPPPSPFYLFAALCATLSSGAGIAAPARTPVYGVDFWRDSEGLARSRVRAVTQTHDGYVWLGTDGGLVRFNGEHFTEFTAQSGALKDNEVWGLQEDDEGGLWVGTFGGGLTRLKDGVFRTFSVADGLPDDVVMSVQKDRKGNIWALTPQGVARYEQRARRLVAETGGLADIHATALAAEAPGGPLIATRAGIYRYAEGGFKLVLGSSLRYGFAEHLLEAADGSLWIGYSGGVIVRQLDGTGRVALSARDADGQTHRLYQDPDGQIWAAAGKKLYRAEGENLVQVKTETGSLPIGAVYSIAKDREGGVWLGLQTNGVARMRLNRLSTLAEEDGLPDDRARSVFEDSRGGVWVGTARGLARYKDRKVRAMPRDGGQIWDVRSIAEDSAGKIWISAGKALLVESGSGFEAVPGWTASYEVEVILRDRRGDIWVGTDGAGLFRYANGRFQNFTMKDGLGSNHVRAILADREGALWISTFGNGVTRYRDARFTVFGSRDGLAGDRVVAMLEDEEGALWFAARQGLSRLANGKFFTWKSDSGLLSSFVYAIVDDGAGNFWFSSPEGIFRVAKSQLRAYALDRIARVTSVAYDEKDGMKTRAGNLGNQPVACRLRTGEMLFSTMRGVAVVDPALLKGDGFVPPVYIERAIVNGHEEKPGRLVRRPLDRGELEIDYTALSYAAPGKLRFRYMLQGFDTDWVEAGSRRFTYYANLPPGKYTFRVAARRGDNEWSETRAPFEAYFTPPFFRTGWFVAAAIAAACLICWGGYVLRIHEMRARYAAVLAERNRISRDIHDTLSQNLAGIALHLDSVHMKLPQVENELRESIEQACHLTRYSLGEARRAIVDLRSDSLEGQPLEAAVPGLARRVAPGLQPRIEVVGRPFRVSPAVEANLLRIVQEALTNAARHAGSCSVLVELHYASHLLALKVRDDGRGFEPAQAAGPEAGHFGLTGIRERAERIGGCLILESAPGSGTELRIEVPL